MLNWLDIAYVVLNVLMAAYSYEKYRSSRRKSFQLLFLGFACLTISDLLWVFALVSLLNNILVLLDYARLGLYTAFILGVFRAMQLLDSKPGLKE